MPAICQFALTLLSVGTMLKDEDDAPQEAAVPPFKPEQVHVHGPEPATEEAVPALHKLAVGALDNEVPLADPHAPLTAAGASKAEQEAVVPPFDPPQVHVQGPDPATEEAAPAAQRLPDGALVKLAPFVEPHIPLTGVGELPDVGDVPDGVNVA
jgi:hypothetical protein